MVEVAEELLVEQMEEEVLQGQMLALKQVLRCPMQI